MTQAEQLRETSVARRLPFGRRLLVAQALVLVTGALATFAAAMVIGPSIFHDHLSQAGMTNSPEETDHVEQAFRSALLVSIGVAVVVAVAAALAASLYFSRRVQRSIGDVAAGASEIAAGRVGAHVADPGLGPEDRRSPRQDDCRICFRMRLGKKRVMKRTCLPLSPTMYSRSLPRLASQITCAASSTV